MTTPKTVDDSAQRHEKQLETHAVQLHALENVVVRLEADRVTDEVAPNVSLSEVQWRIDSAPFKRGDIHVARYVPYVTAAICARLLDQWVGPFNWYDEYTQATIGEVDAIVCRLAVKRLSDGEFIVKQGTGVSPGGSKEMQAKGAVSDAFKRAASLKWGVARNVYLLPSLWAACEVQERGDKKTARPHPDATEQLLTQLTEQGWDHDGTLVIGPEE